MSKRKTLRQFITEAETVHGSHYNYSLVDYKSTNTKVEIICPVHGTFLQTPKSHLRGSGCFSCFHQIKLPASKRYNTNVFIEKANIKHGKKYNYSQVVYKGSRVKVKIYCVYHGLFEMEPASHLYGQGCPKCAHQINGRRLTKEQFIEKAKQVYGTRFDYSLVEYKNSSTLVKIKCPRHGQFDIRPDYFLSNKISCPKCVLEEKTQGERFGGYNETLFNTRPELKTKKAVLYLVEFKDLKEKFYKIGITVQNLKYRFPKWSVNGYKVKVIKVKHSNLYEAFKREQYVIEKLNEFRYAPTRKFNGWSECFTHIPSIKHSID